MTDLAEQLKDHQTEDRNSFLRIDDKLDRILIQTTAHNGRLTRLERKVYMGMGGLIVIAIVVVPLFLKLFSK